MPKRDLLRLRNEWYLKLKEDGFIDIEKAQSEEYGSDLKRYNSTQNFKEAQVEYYEKAKEFLLNYEFPNDGEKLVWELHSQGMTERKIIAWLQIHGIKLEIHHKTEQSGVSKGHIYRILRKYRDIMKDSIL